MRRYFQLSLYLPFALALPGVLLGPVWPPIAALAVAALIGAIPYIPFAIAMYVVIGRCSTVRQLVLLSIAAPAAFGAIAAIFCAWLDIDVRQLGGLAVIVAFFGYVYVAIAWLGFALFRLVAAQGKEIAL